MIPEELDNQQVEDVLQNYSNQRNVNDQPNNISQLHQQQPYIGAHLNILHSNPGDAGNNLVQQRSGPSDGGHNLGNQGSNLVYGFQNAVHPGSYLPQQRSNLYLPNN